MDWWPQGQEARRTQAGQPGLHPSGQAGQANQAKKGKRLLKASERVASSKMRAALSSMSDSEEEEEEEEEEEAGQKKAVVEGREEVGQGGSREGREGEDTAR